MKRSKRAEATRKRIVETAAEMFFEKGTVAVGIDEVIEKAGIARMTLYNHFRNKDELVAEALLFNYMQWTKRFQESVIRSHTDPREQMVLAFDVLEEMLSQNKFRGSALAPSVLELAGNSSTAQETLAPYGSTIPEFLKVLAKKAGAQDAEALGETLNLLIRGAFLGAMIEQRAEPVRRAKAAAKIILASLIPQKQPVAAGRERMTA